MSAATRGLAVDPVGIFDRIRSRCAEVAKRARSVRIDDRALSALCSKITRGELAASPLDPAHRPFADDRVTLAYVVIVDALNFGSGWFPVLAKREGLSGYLSMATCLRERFEKQGPPTTDDLRRFAGPDAARLFQQEPANLEAMELMEHFARALRDLGDLLASRFGGSYAALVESAGGSAARLVALLHEMPLYRDVARFQELEVPFYKRAQITASDLAHAFAGQGWGHFDDLAELTLFADNLVPHVLRREGVLAYADTLASQIDAGQRLCAGSPEETEIRAVALHAVEQMVARLRAAGQVRMTARNLDDILWNTGQRPEIKAHPRHRARSVYY